MAAPSSSDFGRARWPQHGPQHAPQTARQGKRMRVRQQTSRQPQWSFTCTFFQICGRPQQFRVTTAVCVYSRPFAPMPSSCTSRGRSSCWSHEQKPGGGGEGRTLVLMTPGCSEYAVTPLPSAPSRRCSSAACITCASFAWLYRTITPPSVVGGISLTTKSAGSACSPAMEETFTTREGAEVRSSGSSRCVSRKGPM